LLGKAPLQRQGAIGDIGTPFLPLFSQVWFENSTVLKPGNLSGGEQQATRRFWPRTHGEKNPELADFRTK